MDVDNLLNLERRTGVKNADIDDFTRKVDDINAAIKGMLDGTLRPEDVRIDGIETPEEKAKQEAQRQERLEAQRIKNEKLKQERKVEEIKRWWAGAEVFRPQLAKDKGSVVQELSENAEKAVISKSQRYSLDYSKWSDWVPNDDVSKQEEDERAKAEEEKRNKEFEANNADFCEQFQTDMKERAKSVQKKTESSDISRLKGNRYYQAKQYERALELYMEALKDSPFDTKTLANIAQVQIKLNLNEDALEFLNRTLYLEPNHIKALSRKASLCRKMNDIVTAHELVNQVLLLEPQNPDMLTLKNDILSLEKESKDEQTLKELLPSSTVTSSDSRKGRGQEYSFAGAVDALLQLLVESSPQLEAKWLNDVISNILEVVGYLSENEANKLYIRTTGLFVKTIDLLKALISDAGVDVSVVSGPKVAKPAVFDFKSSSHIGALSAGLKLIAISINQQRTSKQVLLDSKLVPFVRQLFTFCVEVTSSDTECGIYSPLVLSVTQFLFECCWDDSLPKLQHLVMSDVSLLGTLATVLKELAVQKVAQGDITFWSENSLFLITNCVFILTQYVAKNVEKEGLKSFANDVTSSVGSILLCHIIMRKTLDHDLWNESTFQSTTQLISLLMYSSLNENMRNSFAVVLPVTSVILKTTAWKPFNRNTTAGALMFAIDTAEEFSVNALAVLMNACLKSSEDVKIAVAKEGGASYLIANLSLTDQQRQSLDTILLTRKAGLMARIAQIESVQNVLRLPSNFRMLCRRVSVKSIHMPDKSVFDERDHYIHTLACLTTLTPECREIGLSENIFASILDCFPTPREDCGVITAQSVILMPLVPVPGLIVGNAAKCLLAYVDDPKYAKHMFCTPSLKCVEKLVCALACYPVDKYLSVLKNISTLIAKGKAIDGVRARVDELRGMEIIMRLKDYLLN